MRAVAAARGQMGQGDIAQRPSRRRAIVDVSLARKHPEEMTTIPTASEQAALVRGERNNRNGSRFQCIPRETNKDKARWRLRGGGVTRWRKPTSSGGGGPWIAARRVAGIALAHGDPVTGHPVRGPRVPGNVPAQVR